jgi:hypothetical protein
MSRVSTWLAAAAVAAFVVPASAGEPPVNAFGLAVAPQGGKASIHQWGGVDDKFAVNPDGDSAPAPATRSAAGAMAQSQDEGDDPDDPGANEDEVLAI